MMMMMDGGSDGDGRSFIGLISDRMLRLKHFCYIITLVIGFEIVAATAAAGPYVRFLCVPFVWIWEKIGVTAAWNNATRILGRVSGSSTRRASSSNRVKFMEEEGGEYSCRCHESINAQTPLTPDDHCILLLNYDIESLIVAETTTQKGKMDAETNKNPLLHQEDNREDEVEHMSNYAFLLLILAFGVLYLLGSAILGRNGNNTSLVICLHAWTAVMMLLLFIGSYIQFPAGVLKIMRLVMSGVISISALVIFILALSAL